MPACTSPPFARDAIEALDNNRVRVHFKAPSRRGAAFADMTVDRFFCRLCALVLPPHRAGHFTDANSVIELSCGTRAIHLWGRSDSRDRVAGIVDQLSELLEILSEEDLSPQLRALAEERYDWRAIAASMADFAASVRDRTSLR